MKLTISNQYSLITYLFLIIVGLDNVAESTQRPGMPGLLQENSVSLDWYTGTTKNTALITLVECMMNVPNDKN